MLDAFGKVGGNRETVLAQSGAGERHGAAVLYIKIECGFKSVQCVRQGVFDIVTNRMDGRDIGKSNEERAVIIFLK